MRVALAAVALTAALGLPSAAAAAPPPNDNIADATELAGLPAEASSATVDATSEFGEPSHRGGGEQSIWFKWTAPASAAIRILRHGCATPPAGSAYSVTVYTGAAADVRTVTSVEQFGWDSDVFRATAGQVYWLAVAPFRGNPPEPAACVRLVPAPANDDFANAATLSGFPAAATSAPSEGAPTVEPGEPTHSADHDASLWYSWQAHATGPVVMRLCPDGGTGPVLAVYTGERVDSLTRVPTRARVVGPCTSVVLNAVTGRLYRIAASTRFSPPSTPGLQLLIGSELAVVTRFDGSFLSYAAVPGRTNAVQVRQEGTGADRALLVNARGVATANGCVAAETPGLLRCRVPGNGRIPLHIDLYDGDDAATVRVDGGLVALNLGGGNDRAAVRIGRGSAAVYGGHGDDVILGASQSYHRDPPLPGYRDVDRLLGSSVRVYGGADADRLEGGGSADGLDGGPGADVLIGGPGYDVLFGGPGGDMIEPGGGPDRAFGGAGRDRVRAADGSVDIVRCQAGGDSARLDGVDVSRSCERRTLRTPARAVPLWAVLAEYTHNLVLLVSCPIDAKRGCDTEVTVRIWRNRTITQSLAVSAGRSGLLSVRKLSDRNKEWIARHGIRVTVLTRRLGTAPLKYTRHLPVSDDRYFGE